MLKLSDSLGSIRPVFLLWFPSYVKLKYEVPGNKRGIRYHEDEA